MTPQPHSVDEIFAAALDCDPAQRTVFLSTCCHGDAALRKEVEDLLASCDSTPEDFLARPAMELMSGGELLSGLAGLPEPRPIEVAPPPPRFAPQQLISSRFVVIRFIARGGMGEVYEVDDRLLGGEHIALKTILPHIAADPALARRFEQEVRLARNLSHRNLCPIYDLAQCTDTEPAFLFLTMKLLSGETLADRLRALEPADEHAPAAPLPLGEAAAITRQLVAGLAAIHAANVVHGDIKPNNVMLSGSGSNVHLHIMDFGLARLHDTGASQVTRSLVGGALGYLAPEILRGGRPSPSSDLFALGIVLHKVLTGALPDPADASSGATLPRLVGSDAPPALIHFIRELLADDPQRRATAFTEMKLYFGVSEGLASDPDAGKPRPVWAPPKPAPVLTRRRVLFGAGAAAACAATGTLAWNRDLLDDLLHPLPSKRFVSIINWPPTKDIHLKPMLMGLIELIGNELARAEAFDHNLYVVPHVSSTDITTPAQINAIRQSAGTNLVLAASGAPVGSGVGLTLAVLDSDPSRVLRSKRLRITEQQPGSTRVKAVEAAADILDVRRWRTDPKRMDDGTDRPDALNAFEAGRTAMALPNDIALQSAIEHYKRAVELDSHFAKAYAQLSLAYFRDYILHRNPGTLILARANADTAISLDEGMVDAHLALASALDWGGDRIAAAKETAKAVAIDGNDPKALIFHAQTLQRCNRWTDAETFYKRLMRARPNYWLAHEELATLYADQGDYTGALLEFHAANIARPTATIAMVNIAGVLLQQGRLSEAKDYAARSLSLRRTPDGLANLAEVLRCEGDTDKATALAQEAVTLSPSDPLNWLLLGDCAAAELKLTPLAKKAYGSFLEQQMEACEADPRDGPGWMLLALARAKSGTPQESVALISKAEASFAAEMSAQLCKVRVLAILHRIDHAFATMQACLARGATKFQFQTMPDLSTLKSDPRYQKYLD